MTGQLVLHPRARRTNRWVSTVAVAVLAFVGTILMLQGRALAHAELRSTSPRAGDVLEDGPAAITLRFSEPVEINFGGIRLFDGAGREIAIGDTVHPGGRDNEAEVALDQLAELADGSYVVDWRVVSADSHPLQGAFTFQVGDTSDLQPGIVADIVADDGTSQAARTGLTIARALVIAAIAVVFGGLIAFGWGMIELTKRTRMIIAAGANVGLLAGLLHLPLQAGYASGRSLAAIFELDAWRSAFDSRVGAAWVIRAALIALCGGGLLISAAHRATTWWRALAVGGLLAVGLASAYGGHGATGRWAPIGVLATVLHVGAMAVWLGGLLLVAIEFRHASAVAVRRFSSTATVMMALIVATGLVQSYRQLESLDALTDSTFGTALIRKLVAVLMVLVVASLARRIVRRDSIDTPRLGRSIAVEVIVAVVIVAFTSQLMAANPSTAAESKPFSANVVDGDYFAAITIDPARVGANEMHIFVTSTSSLTRPDDVVVEISDPGRDTALIEVPVTFSGANHFTTSAATFPYAATWTVIVTARYNTFDEVQFVAEVPVR